MAFSEKLNFISNQKIHPQNVKGNLCFTILKIQRATEKTFALFKLPNVCFSNLKVLKFIEILSNFLWARSWKKWPLLSNNGILLLKLFWPTVRRNCSSDREKLFWKLFEITRTIYSNSERSEQFLVTECFFNLVLEVSQIL